MSDFHNCPRCLTKTGLKCYCADCLAVLKKPPCPRRSAEVPHGWMWREKGKNL